MAGWVSVPARTSTSSVRPGPGSSRTAAPGGGASHSSFGRIDTA